MKIDFTETTNDLATRIDIHSKFGSRNIDRWTLDLVKLKPQSLILDVGCGAGKQCFSYFDELNGNATITGGDVSEDLLQQAKNEAEKRKAPITFIPLDFNQKFPLEDNVFDFVSCCFAIYYATNVPFTIGEMHRVLKPGGHLFTTGPMPENKQVFYDVIREATDNRTIPLMPGSSRYGSTFLQTIRSVFSSVEIHIFENPLVFTSAEPFLTYTRASLSEDRRLWNSFFKDKEEFENIMANIRSVAEKRILRDGKLVMTKVVGGFLATK